MKLFPVLVSLNIVFAGCATTGVTVHDQSRGSVELPNGAARKIVKNVAPEYPAHLRAKRIAGAVVVRLWVLPDGKVDRTEARYSPHPELIPLAIDAVKQWIFEPARDGNKQILVLEIPITFEVRDKEKK